MFHSEVDKCVNSIVSRNNNFYNIFFRLELIDVINSKPIMYLPFRARLDETEVNSNLFEISFRSKISLWCEVTSLSALT